MITNTLRLIAVAACVIAPWAPAGAAEVAWPDLTVEIRGPRAATAGNEIGGVLWLVVRNRGAAPAAGGASGYQVHLYLSHERGTPPQPRARANGYRENAMLPGGQVAHTVDLHGGRSRRYAVSVRIPRDTPAGRYYLCAMVDPGNSVREHDEHNNVDCSLIHVRPAPSAGVDADPLLRVPRQLQPEHGAVVHSDHGTVNLRWQSQAGVRYDLEVECRGCGSADAPGDDLPQAYLAATALKRAHFTLTFPAGHSGRWRVRTLRGKLQGPWSEWQEFSMRNREP